MFSEYAHIVNLRRLAYFLTLAEELNYGRAARRLRVAGPSLSQQIKLLERELKVQLFERDSRSVRLTSAGAALLPHAQALLVQADELRRRAGDLVREQPLRLGLVDPCPIELTEQALAAAPVSVDTWVMPSHIQATRVSVGNLDLAICHVNTADLKSLNLKAHLVKVDRLHTIGVGSDPSPTKAKDTAVLIEADTSSWLSWNTYGEEFAEENDAVAVGIEDGGIAGDSFFDHARRIGRPIVNAPKGPTDPLPEDMVRRPIIEPTPLWTWSLVRRRTDERSTVRAVIKALTRGPAAPDLTSGAHWLPHHDPHRRYFEK